MKRFFLSVLFLFIFAYVFGSLVSVNAASASFTITPPAGPFNRGQNIDFTITIDTQGQTVSSTSVGMTYDMEYLEYVSIAPGDAFTSVDAQTQEATDYNFPQSGVKKAGRLIINGSNTSGFSGTGTFAIVTFKLIASSPGSAELCVLYNPEITPTPIPVTSVPQPTALPKTGTMSQITQGAIIGFGLLLIIASGFLLVKNPSQQSINRQR